MKNPYLVCLFLVATIIISPLNLYATTIDSSTNTCELLRIPNSVSERDTTVDEFCIKNLKENGFVLNSTTRGLFTDHYLKQEITTSLMDECISHLKTTDDKYFTENCNSQLEPVLASWVEQRQAYNQFPEQVLKYYNYIKLVFLVILSGSTILLFLGLSQLFKKADKTNGKKKVLCAIGIYFIVLCLWIPMNRILWS